MASRARWEDDVTWPTVSGSRRARPSSPPSGSAGPCGWATGCRLGDGPGRRRAAAAPTTPGGQARRCFEIIEAALAEAGASLDDVVRTRMYITVGRATPTPSARCTASCSGTCGPRRPWSSWRDCSTPPGRWRSKPRRCCPKTCARRGEPRDGGGDDVGAAQVADEARLHAVHHVADGELRVLVDDDDRAAVAAPVTGARAERHVGRVAQAVAHADALLARRAPCRCRRPAPRRSGRCPRPRAGARRGPRPVPAMIDWMAATERALPWPLAAGISARRHHS